MKEIKKILTYLKDQNAEVAIFLKSGLYQDQLKIENISNECVHFKLGKDISFYFLLSQIEGIRLE
jgi:hypothetical protein